LADGVLRNVYDSARLLVIADGWDTLRSMITGWATKFRRPEVSDREL
jgi:hypothetical protein